MRSYNIGFLDAVVESKEGTRNVFVGRVSKNIYEQSSIGFLSTIGDPNSNEMNALAGTDYKDAVGFKVEFKTTATDDVDPFVITSTGALATPIIADIDHVAGKVIVTVADTNVAAADIKLFAGSAPITMGDKFKAVTGLSLIHI